MEILESGKVPRRAEEKLATQLIFETYLSLISALQRGELIVKGRDRALAGAHVVPASYWHSELSYVSWRRNELLRIDGDQRQVLAEDLTVFVAQSSKTKRGSKSDNKARFVEAEVIRFLETLEDQPRAKKAHVRKEVLQRFPGVSGRQFDRLWGDYAPQSFKQAGRIPSK
ncbi:hypothetical protein [Pseudovibrio sp. Ad26]|uniref:hypothetical protein n=1 Tax=Pseudovibrio sp. Ad26 TaxID=989410 RepID=UPI0007AED742|nr:hypothetical protein [Pseudovibrio sp. Ad26]KZL10442.1 hypothetical protein PsAD26_03124 [Pseudovibrio sp. Ad26]